MHVHPKHFIRNTLLALGSAPFALKTATMLETFLLRFWSMLT